MRLRNIPEAAGYLAASPYVVHNPKEQKGKWRELFGNENPLHVEIGTGKGRFIVEMAALHPEINYVGLEKYSSVLYKAAKKQAAAALPNLYLVCWEAELLGDIFEKHEIDRIYLNFSDPWPKRSQAPRRLPSKEFLRLYYGLLKDTGTIEFKTDNRPLFDFAVDEVPQGGFQIDALTYDLHSDPKMGEGNVETEYEAKFSAKGNPICKYIISKAPRRA